MAFTADQKAAYPRGGRAPRHGDSLRGARSVEYRTWIGVKTRCGNPREKSFVAYGGRGIVLCERWAKYENFLADMGRRPSPEHSIDRIDNDGPYSPENCRWATRSQQANNKSNCVRVTAFGLTMGVSQWARACGIKRLTLRARLLVSKWPPERALREWSPWGEAFA